jgi:galactokinase
MRRAEASHALEKLREFGVNTYKDISLSLLEEKKGVLGETLYLRARHVVSENERVKKAIMALHDEDFQEMGQLLFQSHESLRDDYQVSCPELDLLYEYGRQSSSCLGARLTGAGFGGSGIALVYKEDIPCFRSHISSEARKKGFVAPACHEVEIGEGVRTRRKGED